MLNIILLELFGGCALLALVWRHQQLYGTTLMAAWYWSVLAILSIMIVETLVNLRADWLSPSRIGPLRYLAAILNSLSHRCPARRQASPASRLAMDRIISVGGPGDACSHCFIFFPANVRSRDPLVLVSAHSGGDDIHKLSTNLLLASRSAGRDIPNFPAFQSASRRAAFGPLARSPQFPLDRDCRSGPVVAGSYFCAVDFQSKKDLESKSRHPTRSHLARFSR